MSDENLRFDDAIIGWSDTTPDSATASATSGGGYVKLDDSFLTGETIVTLPVSKKLYTVDDNGNLKKDDNGNAIEASWNEQSLHKLRKGFITSVSSSPLSLVYKAGSQGVGFLAKTSTVKLTLAAATRFSNRRQRSKYITCDATFINLDDYSNMTSADGSPGRFTIKNAKLNVLYLEPKYLRAYGVDEDSDITTSATPREINDSIMYQIAPQNTLDKSVIGHLNIGLDFETISRIEEWDTFLNEVADVRNSKNNTGITTSTFSRKNGIMRLQLSIHQNGYKSSSNKAIGIPTFSFFVSLLPRDNLKVEYDTSSPYVSRNYSFQIVEPPKDNIKFTFRGQNNYHEINPDCKVLNFTLSGYLPEDKPIIISEHFRDGMCFADAYTHQIRSFEEDWRPGAPYAFTQTGNYADRLSDANICVIFEIDDVVILDGYDGTDEFYYKQVATIKDIRGYDKSCKYVSADRGRDLASKIQDMFIKINDGLNSNGLDTKSPSFIKEASIPYLTIMKHYGRKTVVTRNLFDFANRTRLDLVGFQLLDNSWKNNIKHNSLTGSVPINLATNHVKIAAYFL